VASLGLDIGAMHGGVRLRVDGRSRAGPVQVAAVGYELTLNAVQLTVGDDATTSVLLDEAEANHGVTLLTARRCRQLTQTSRAQPRTWIRRVMRNP